MSNGIKLDFGDLFGVDFAQQTTTPKKTKLNDLFGVDFKISKYTIEKVEDQEYDHISRDEFIEISGGDFGWIGEGREETMQDRLYDIYNPDRDEDGIQFEQYGTGNNIRVITPWDTDNPLEIGLSGDAGVEAKTNYIDLVEHIESKSRRIEILPETKTELENIFLGEQADYKSGTVGVGTGLISPPLAIYGAAYGLITKDLLDDEIAEQLRLSSLGGEEYQFETAKWFKNAITVTTPNGTEKTFNISALKGDDVEEKKKVLNSMIKFIEADPRNYTLTTEYINAFSGMDKELESILERFEEDTEMGLKLLANDADLTKRLQKHFGVHWVQFEDSRIFKDLTYKQQKDLIDDRIRKTISNTKDKVSINLFNKELERLTETGEVKDNGLIYVKKGIRDRFSGYDLEIYDLWMELVEGGENLDPTKKQDLINKIKSKKKLKEEAGLGDYSFLLNENTFDRSLNIERDESKGIIDLTAEVNDKINNHLKKVKKEKLTIKDIEAKTIIVNLAHNGAVKEWGSNETRKFYLDPKKIEWFANTDYEKRHRIRTETRSRKTGEVIVGYQTPIGAPDKDVYTRSYIVTSDAEASRGLLSNYLLLDDDDGHQSRKQLLIDLKVDREVYDQIYGLNETLESQKKAGFFPSLGDHFIRSLTGKDYELINGVSSEQYR